MNQMINQSHIFIEISIGCHVGLLMLPLLLFSSIFVYDNAYINDKLMKGLHVKCNESKMCHAIYKKLKHF